MDNVICTGTEMDCYHDVHVASTTNAIRLECEPNFICKVSTDGSDTTFVAASVPYT
jgi:hypothetical protein